MGGCRHFWPCPKGVAHWPFCPVYPRVLFSQRVIRTADKDSQLSTDELDFPGMHWIQKHPICLVDDIEAFTERLNAASYHYERVTASSSTDASVMASASMSSTQSGLRYMKILLRFTDLRLWSLEKRTQSIINLVDLQSPPLSSSNEEHWDSYHDLSALHGCGGKKQSLPCLLHTLPSHLIGPDLL